MILYYAYDELQRHQLDQEGQRMALLKSHAPAYQLQEDRRPVITA